MKADDSKFLDAVNGDVAMGGPSKGGRGGMTGEFDGNSSFELPKTGDTGVVLNPDDLLA